MPNDIRPMLVRIAAKVAAFVIFSFAFWNVWRLVFGYPNGGMRYVALISCLLLLRVGSVTFDRIRP